MLSYSLNCLIVGPIQFSCPPSAPKVLPSIQKAAPEAIANDDVDTKAGVEQLNEKAEQAAEQPERERIVAAKTEEEAVSKATKAKEAAAKEKEEATAAKANLDEEAATTAATAQLKEQEEAAAAKAQGDAEAALTAKAEEERLAAAVPRLY